MYFKKAKPLFRSFSVSTISLFQVEEEEIALAAGDHRAGSGRNRPPRVHLYSSHDHRHSFVGRTKDSRPLQERQQAQEEPGRRRWSGRITHPFTSIGNFIYSNAPGQIIARQFTSGQFIAIKLS